MKKAWTWIKKWGGVVFGSLAAVLLLLLGGGWLWRRKQAELGAVKDELAVERAKRDIERLRATRKEVARQVGEKDEAIAEIDRQLAKNRRKLADAHEGGENLTDEQVEAALERLGI